jgi:hypothetical protein
MSLVYQNSAQKLYYDSNPEYREKRRQQWKDYHQKNIDDRREKAREKAKEKFDCECGGKYTYFVKTKHYRTKKHTFYQETYDYIYS